MAQRLLIRLLAGLVVCVIGGASVVAAEDGLTIEPLPASLPDDLPDWLLPLLESDGVRAKSGGAVLADLWFRRELPERTPTGEMGIELGTLPEGALVGLVRLASPWSDYKKQPIQPGLYTLRYGVQPADGDHTGQTWFRDFLMLVAVERDVFQADGAAQEPVVEASKAVSTTAHPAVMALFGVYDEVSAPTLVENDLGQPMLAMPFDSLLAGFVLEGHGEEATM
jgi:hypothetical protein